MYYQKSIKNHAEICVIQYFIVTLQAKFDHIKQKIMATVQLDGEILRNLGIIAEDENTLSKVAKYLRRMAKQTSKDQTLMSKEEFLARVEEAEKEIKEGKGIAFTNKADMNAWLNTL